MQFITIALAALASFASAKPISTLKSSGVSDACALQPDGYGPVPSNTAASAFQKYGTFSTVSTAAITPYGYQRTFHNHLQSTSGGNYMGLYTLTAYDPIACSSLCNATTSCQGFNVFYERDPQYNPAPACLNPSPITNYKCTLWGLPPTVANATNAGETRMQFAVVVAGSNGYAKIGSVAKNLFDDGTNPYN